MLAKAEDSAASTAIERLNALNVRHVLSAPIHQELASFCGPRDRNIRLYDRLCGLHISPLCLTPLYDSWQFLLASEEESREMASAYAGVSAAKTEVAAELAFARSLPENPQHWSKQVRETYVAAHGEDTLRVLSKASRLPPAERLAASLEVVAPMLENAIRDAEKVLETFADVDLEAWAELLPPSKREAIRTLRSTAQALIQMQRQMLEGKGPNEAQIDDLRASPIYQFDESKDAVVQLALRNDARMHSVVRGKASAKALRNLGHTERDCEHLVALFDYRDEIDFMQLDGPFFRRVQNDRGRHPLVQAGLIDRVFTANRLEAIVSSVEMLAKVVSP